MRKEHFIIAAGLAAATLALVGPAAAQSTVIDGGSIFGAFRPWLIEIASVVVAGIVAWGFRLFQTKTGIQIEDSRRDAIQTAITNAAGSLIARAGGAAEALKVDVKSEAVAAAVNYAIKGAPDALAYFGVTPERIREMIMAKVGVLAAPAGAAPSATPPAP